MANIRSSRASGDAPSESHDDGPSFPLREFFRAEAASGILLFLAAVAAIVWANSRWGDSYFALWNTKLAIGPTGHAIEETLAHWIADGLMAIFFFVVGLEIKREVLIGDLSTVRKATLPIMAAVGGVVFPALIYLAFNRGTPEARGWGIPMGTDIAFALGVLVLIGSRAPAGLKLILTASAIVDDLISVLVIAFFYNDGINWPLVGLAAVVLLVLFGLNRAGVRSILPYAVLGVVLWLLILESSIHATIAGVLLAMTIPASTWIDPATFLAKSHRILNDFAEAGDLNDDIRQNAERQAAVQELEAACADVEAPLQRLEHLLHPWVAFLVMPLFALANAGVRFDTGLLDALSNRVTLGVLLGLVVGKQIGIFGGSLAAVRLGLADLPRGVAWRHVSGMAWVCGIGFTMSLFITDLAFDDSAAVAASKIGIILASVIAGTLGTVSLLRAGPESGGE